MRRQQALESRPAPAQVLDRRLDGRNLLQDLLTTVEAAECLHYTGPAATKQFCKWADRHRIPRLHRGRICLWQSSILLAFLRRDAWTRRHDLTVPPIQIVRKRRSDARTSVAGEATR